MRRITRFYFISLDILWALALIGLPLTTFPLFTNLTGAIVAPFPGLPLLLILILWLLPVLILQRNTTRLPIEVWPLFIFVLVALLSAVVAPFIQIPTLKNSSPLYQELRAFFTLAIGLAIYLVCASWPSDSKKLQKSLQWINIGGILMLLWTLTQVNYILTNATSYPQWILDIQKYLVIKPEYFFFRGNRTSGLAYEASWFAHQLVMLYIPLWLAATILNKSAFKFRILRIKNFQGFTLENILLPIGLFEFLLSSPRIALISLLLIFLFLFLRFNLNIVRKITQLLLKRRNSNQPTSLLIRLSIIIVTVLILTLVYVGLAFGAAYLMSQRDWRLALLFSSKFSWLEINNLLRLDESTIIIYGARLAFLERVVYLLNGWHVFNDYPFLGVGLGNVGFFFVQKVPSVGWMSYEIRNVINMITNVPNIKGFWMRLLAETGILGFYVFISWYYVIGKSARLLQHSTDSTAKIIALAGLLSLVAFIGEGFSIDSFAMPYLWVIAGFVSVNSMVYRREVTQKPASP
jgi:hypothetical protein